MTLLALILATFGFALFAVASEPHARRFAFVPVGNAPRRRWRRAGWIALIAALPPSVAASGWVFGPVLWSGLVMLGAGLVFVTLNLIFPPVALRKRSMIAPARSSKTCAMGPHFRGSRRN